MPPSTFIERFNGTAIFETGTLLDDGSCGENDVDVVAAWNAANDPPDLSEAVNWTPTLVTGLQAAGDVRKAVQRYAGPSGNSRR